MGGESTFEEPGAGLVREREIGEDNLDKEAGRPSPWLQRFGISVLRFLLALMLVSTTFVVYSYLRVHPLLSSPSRGSDFVGAFFVFGDSYADIGNIPYGEARSLPYGETWPGYPSGRFSDGKVQSDYLATQVLGRPCPPAFAQTTPASLFQGANFAVGGAGFTHAYGSPNISTQVGWFESVVKSGFYSKKSLASSVAFLCVAGNDYGAYRGPLKYYIEFVKEVVGLFEQSLRKLYSLGLRNIMVTTLAPLNCLPASTSLVGYLNCNPNATVEHLVSYHNSFLETTLENLSSNLSGINFILLGQGEALKHIQTNNTLFNITQPLKPCCLGYCGRVDSFGNLLYTLCTNPENHAIWDEVHPTQVAWENIVDLYVKDESFTKFAPTLQHWAQKLSLF